MVRSVDQYLSELPEDRRHVVSTVRDLVLLHLPDGYRESVNWGMIAYEIPLERYPNTYNGQPLAYVALASQKNHVGLYLMSISVLPAQLAQLKAAFAKAGKRLDVGKSCLRFKTLDDLVVASVAQVIASMPPEAYIEHYEASRAAHATTAKPQTVKATVKATTRKTKKAKPSRAAKATKVAAKRTVKRGLAKAKKIAKAKKAKRVTAKTRKAWGARATRVTRLGRTRRRP